MFSSLIRAYKSGQRTGAAEPGIEEVNGHRYLKQPQSPYIKLHLIFLNLAWQEGLYSGMIRRLSDY